MSGRSHRSRSEHTHAHGARARAGLPQPGLKQRPARPIWDRSPHSPKSPLNAKRCCCCSPPKDERGRFSTVTQVKSEWLKEEDEGSVSEWAQEKCVELVKGPWTLEEDERVSAGARALAPAGGAGADADLRLAGGGVGAQVRQEALVADRQAHAQPQRQTVPRALAQPPQPQSHQESLDPRGGPHHLPGAKGAGEPLGQHFQASARQARQCHQEPLELHPEEEGAEGGPVPHPPATPGLGGAPQHFVQLLVVRLLRLGGLLLLLVLVLLVLLHLVFRRRPGVVQGRGGGRGPPDERRDPGHVDGLEPRPRRRAQGPGRRLVPLGGSPDEQRDSDHAERVEPRPQWGAQGPSRRAVSLGAAGSRRRGRREALGRRRGARGRRPGRRRALLLPADGSGSVVVPAARRARGRRRVGQNQKRAR
ncbi:uncharacterized protein LOC133510666 isoform X2 [Syngnathoides biaculeatus]|uniref:uncharacterized protein LOC133510666 isoform X2 n=1 Tax=Syngnathoides biaculeatus TaxID=300417 RepID=UPI002ADD8466|nr:uncharacterized protein LOC133510666 isoform X2 [Syngnathoides biaculeatus]